MPRMRIPSLAHASMISRAMSRVNKSSGVSLKLAFIGKYLSCLRKLHYVIAPKEGFEAQLRAPRVPIPCGMRALGMTRQIGDGHLQRVIEPGHVPGLQCLDNPA